MTYIDRIMSATKTGAFSPGTLAHIEVAHDDDCELYAGKSQNCTCEPDICDGAVEVLADGSWRRLGD